MPLLNPDAHIRPCLPQRSEVQGFSHCPEQENNKTYCSLKKVKVQIFYITVTAEFQGARLRKKLFQLSLRLPGIKGDSSALMKHVHSCNSFS